MKKVISFQLKPSKTSRTISFEIELTKIEKPVRDYNTLEVLESGVRLSVRGATHKGGVACQMYDEILTYYNRVKKDDFDLFKFIMGVWRTYHLNDMQAGTYRQESALYAYRYKAVGYTQSCELLKRLGIYVDRGYTYGTDWLYKPIPEKILNKLIYLINKQD